jgi:hypothetical protein
MVHMLAYPSYSLEFHVSPALSSIIVYALPRVQVRQQLDVEIPAVFPSYDGTFQATSLLFVELIPQYLTCRTCPFTAANVVALLCDNCNSIPTASLPALYFRGEGGCDCSFDNTRQAS